MRFSGGTRRGSFQFSRKASTAFLPTGLFFRASAQRVSWLRQAFSNIRKPFPNVRKPLRNIRKPFPNTRKSLRNIRKPFPNTQKYLRNIRKLFPNLGKPLRNIGKPFPNLGKPLRTIGKPFPNLGKCCPDVANSPTPSGRLRPQAGQVCGSVQQRQLLAERKPHAVSSSGANRVPKFFQNWVKMCVHP